MWDVIRDFGRGDWVGGLLGLAGVALAVVLLVRWARLKARNLKHMGDELRAVAQALSGTYQGPGLFGRRPSIRGTYEGMPVAVDFPDDWRGTFLGAETVAAKALVRVRLTVPRDLKASVQLPHGGGELAIRRGVATARMPVEWDVDQLPASRVLAFVESVHAAVRKVMRHR